MGPAILPLSVDFILTRIPSMPLPPALELGLSLPGLPELAPLVRDFTNRALELAGFKEARRADLLDAVLSAVALVEDALENVGDEATPLELSASVTSDHVEFRILEHGLPLGEEIEHPAGADIRRRIRPSQVFDRVYWVQKGREGSELHLVAHRDDAAIQVIEDARHRLEEAHEEAAHADLDPSGRTGEYRIRDYAAEDGLSIARRIYEAYGRSYPNPDLYVPARIERLNREGRLHSIVCESPDGDVVGHYALERPDLGAVGEAGQAVIDHRHRGHGLMKPMRRAVEEAGGALGLLGIWSQPTARHPISQRMNLGFGSTPSALCLGTTPAGSTLRGGVAGQVENETMPARHSCFLYWHALGEEPPLVAHVPERLAPLLESLYAARGREVRMETDRVPAPSGHATVGTRFDPARGVAWISVDRVTDGGLDAVRAALDAMESSVGAATVFVDLPIDQPGTTGLAAALLDEGMRLAGIGPRFRPVDDDRRAEDVLRLQLNPAPVDLEGLVVEGELGRSLADAVLAGGTDTG